MAPSEIVRVAVPAPLSNGFDYILPSEQRQAITSGDLKGFRVVVPFGRGVRVGVILDHIGASQIDREKLKSIKQVLDTRPTIPTEILSLLNWASTYYQYPIGEAVATALPAALRKFRASADSRANIERYWQLTELGHRADPKSLRRAPVQQRVLAHLQQTGAAGREQLSVLGSSWRASVRRLCERGLLEAAEVSGAIPAESQTVVERNRLELNDDQNRVLRDLKGAGAEFDPVLLDGVTGSGKTEIYLRKASEVVERGRQVLLIVPEIGLTPQLVTRFQRHFGGSVWALHSALSDGERLRQWRRAASGEASVVVGTRSSVFVPMPALGLIIVDEEHDGSLKQQDGFRYHARDLALVRGRERKIPVILGSATPALETFYNANNGKYRHLRLDKRAGDAQAPTITLLDTGRNPLNEGLSEALIKRMREHLERGQQVMAYLNRRGYAPVMLCGGCDTVMDCQRCDAHMTMHARSRRLRCHHCGAERPVPDVCPECGERALAIAGEGTERIEYALRAAFPGKTVVRIDRDTTRRKGSLQGRLEQARSGEADILVGTQMLAKGHHFPGVTLVAMLDVDRSLFSVDFRASELMAQTIVQVAGRAGRADQPGEVLIQTRHPKNELYQTLIHRGYHSFATSVLGERRQLALPPYCKFALLRAEASAPRAAREFLQQMKAVIGDWEHRGVQVLGPAAAPVERVAGRYRAQLLLSARARKALHVLLVKLRQELEVSRQARKVRWSLDVDPVDMM